MRYASLFTDEEPMAFGLENELPRVLRWDENPFSLPEAYVSLHHVAGALNLVQCTGHEEHEDTQQRGCCLWRVILAELVDTQRPVQGHSAPRQPRTSPSLQPEDPPPSFSNMIANRGY